MAPKATPSHNGPIGHILNLTTPGRIEQLKRDLKICEAIRSGQSRKAVAEQFKLSQPQLSVLVARYVALDVTLVRQALEARMTEVCSALASGESTCQVAQRLRLDPRVISAIAQVAGMEMCRAKRPPPGPGESRRKRDPEYAIREQQILKALRQGEPMGAVAKLHGVSRERVRQIGKALGYERMVELDKRRDAMIEQIRAGKPLNEISADFKTTAAYIGKLASEERIPVTDASLGRTDRTLRILAHLMAGESHGSIAKQYRVSVHYVAQLASRARKAGMPIGRPAARPPLMRLSTMQVLARLLAGEAPKEIARDMGISRPAVESLESKTRRAGIPVPHRRERTRASSN